MGDLKVPQLVVMICKVRGQIQWLVLRELGL
jgi:hypothetical protein